eukprot:764126-Hanusia_phi.AAC.1
MDGKPVVVEYVPAGQSWHVAMLVVEQGVHDVAAIPNEYEPLGHREHELVPEGLYFPAGQAVQPDPSYPGLHRQALEEVLPAGDVECAGHEEHVLLGKSSQRHAERQSSSSPAVH